MLTNLLYVLLAILLLGIVIFIHELGHFIVGRLCGIGVTEFAMGFGPKVFSCKRKGIEYSLRALPLGGFCRFVDDDDPQASNAMSKAPVWKRILTVFSGPAMNFILAYVAAVIMLCIYYTGTITPVVDTIVDGSPAQIAQLQPGDTVISANDVEITNDYMGVEQLRALIQQNDSLELTVDRGGESVELTLVPELVALEDGSTVKQIGITFTAEYTRMSLPEAIPGAGQYMLDTTRAMLDFLRNLIFKGEGAEGMAGAVGTVAVVSEALQANSSMFLNFLFVISLNLGIMNLLPLPALDGGRLVFLIVEAIRRKPIPPEKEGMVHAIGMMLLLGLAVVLTWHDITTFIIK